VNSQAVGYLITELINTAARVVLAVAGDPDATKPCSATQVFSDGEVSFLHVEFDAQQFEITVREIRHPSILKLERK
jgi:hypothetical protein